MKKQREHWNSQFGFMMAAAGSAIGLGTLWMFPYVTGNNGGGLFVLLYFIFIFTIGVPVFIAELLLGRRAQRSAVGVFIHHTPDRPAWKIIGWLGVFSSFLIMTFYSVVSGWGLNYTLMSLNQCWAGRSPEEIANIFDTLEKSADITVFWHFVFLAIVGTIVYQGVRKGIEQWSRIITKILLVALLILFCYSLTLSGFSDAVHFLFYPDISKFKASGALEALGLSFFTLSLGQGIMLTYGSYMKSDENIAKMSAIIGFAVVLASVLCALMIFPIIFTYASSCSVKEGPGLVFKTLPIIFSQLPTGALLISTLFFTMFVFTAITSAVAFLEAIAANFIDLYGWSRKRAVLITVGILAIGTLPCALSPSRTLFATWVDMYGISFLETTTSLVATWLLPAGGLLLAIYTGWILKRDELLKGFGESFNGNWWFSLWLFLLRWVVPCATILILLHKSGLINMDEFLHIQQLSLEEL